MGLQDCEWVDKGTLDLTSVHCMHIFNNRLNFINVYN